MTETKERRRGWVKNAAIIFLAVLLVLTFFSNTWLNRSLPEVAAQYPTSGSINLKIRGEGTVSANQIEKVSIAESRKIKGVAVRVGDTVTKGQALFLLADTESAELDAAQKNLDTLELAYEKALLDRSVGSGTNYEVQKAQLALEAAMERRDKAKEYDAERKPLELAATEAATALAAAISNAEQLPEKIALDAATEAKTQAEAAQTKAKSDFDYYAKLHGISDYQGLADQLETLQDELDKAWDTIDKLNDEISELERKKQAAESGEGTARQNLLSTITEAAESYLYSPRPAQQLEEIKAQYTAAKAAWDAIVSVRYQDCVDVEKNNPSSTFYGPVRLSDVTVFVTSSSFGSGDEGQQMVDNAANLTTTELTQAYRSMVWWHMTADAAEALAAASGDDASLEAIRKELEAKNDEYDTQWDALKKKEADYDETRSILNDRELSAAYDAVLEANEAVKRAGDDVYAAKLAYDSAAKAPSVNVDAAQKTYDKAKEQLDALEKAYTGVGTYAEEKQNVLNAQEALENVYLNQKKEDIQDQKDELDLQQQKEELDKARKQVEELTKNASETIIYAPCDGTISAMHVAAGDTTVMNEAMAEIELTDQGHTLSFEVSKEQAARVKVGDQAEISGRWGADIRATLASIGNSKTNPGESKVLTFDLKGEDVVAGQSLTLSVGSKSQNYEVIVPNAAVRQDSQGKFVLVVNSKSTPLGNRYYVNRVDVDVQATDDDNSAVKGMITTSDFVVMTSTAPLKSGDQVRLPES